MKRYFVLAMLAACPESVAAEHPVCVAKGISLRGDVQIVDSFPDLKVQIVESFPDLRVMAVESFADTCGKWRFVYSFPDFTIQYVDSFPDLKIQMVESFPGPP